MERRLFSSESLATYSGNSTADSAAKDVLDGDVSDKYTPFSDLKPRRNNYIAEHWQNEWDNYPLNKLHKINPKINDFPKSCNSSRREETFYNGYILAIHI